MIDKLKIYSFIKRKKMIFSNDVQKKESKESNHYYLSLTNQGIPFEQHKKASIKLHYRDSDGFMSIEFNPTKLVFGHNYIVEYSDKVLPDAFRKLYKILFPYIINIHELDFSNFIIGKLEFGKNIILDEDPKIYLMELAKNPISKKFMKRNTHFTTISYNNSTSEIIVYDKTEECHKKNKNRANYIQFTCIENMLRIELKLSNDKFKTKGYCGRNLLFGELFNDFTIYFLHKKLFSEYNEYFCSLINTGNNIFIDFAPICEKLKLKSTPMNCFNLYTMSLSLDHHSQDEIIFSFKNLYDGDLSRNDLYRIKKRLNEIPRPINKDLIQEIKDKLYISCNEMYSEKQKMLLGMNYQIYNNEKTFPLIDLSEFRKISNEYNFLIVK